MYEMKMLSLLTDAKKSFRLINRKEGYCSSYGSDFMMSLASTCDTGESSIRQVLTQSLRTGRWHNILGGTVESTMSSFANDCTYLASW